jgi:hypothetical protein
MQVEAEWSTLQYDAIRSGGTPITRLVWGTGLIPLREAPELFLMCLYCVDGKFVLLYIRGTVSLFSPILLCIILFKHDTRHSFYTLAFHSLKCHPARYSVTIIITIAMQFFTILGLVGAVSATSAIQMSRALNGNPLLAIAERQLTVCRPVTPGPNQCARSCGPGNVQCVTASNCYNPSQGEKCCSNGSTLTPFSSHVFARCP